MDFVWTWDLIGTFSLQGEGGGGGGRERGSRGGGGDSGGGEEKVMGWV